MCHWPLHHIGFLIEAECKFDITFQKYLQTFNLSFDLLSRYDLFAEVKDMKVSANNSEVRATLEKIEPVKWKGLLQNGAKKGTIKLDFSRAVDSDDETDSEEDKAILPPPQPLPTAENVRIKYKHLKLSQCY